MVSDVVHIGNRTIRSGSPTYVIAEVGINHGGSVDHALRLITEAAKAGADAVKFQTYRTETRVAADSPLFPILKAAELDADAHATLRAAAADAGVAFISTPFDSESVELLAALKVDAYKIASFDIVNLALVQGVARRGKPVIVSRGMADVSESDTALALLGGDSAQAILLHCVSAYPLAPTDANLAVIRTLKDRYSCPIGYSDHTIGVDVPVLAVAAGALVLEKHFTLDRSAPGPDHALSADPTQFAALVRRVREVECILGSSIPRVVDAEAGTTAFRRATAAD